MVCWSYYIAASTEENEAKDSCGMWMYNWYAEPFHCPRARKIHTCLGSGGCWPYPEAMAGVWTGIDACGNQQSSHLHHKLLPCEKCAICELKQGAGFGLRLATFGNIVVMGHSWCPV